MEIQMKRHFKGQGLVEYALDLLQDAVATIEERNLELVVYTDAQSFVLEMFITGLEYAGEDGLATKLTADSEACGN